MLPDDLWELIFQKCECATLAALECVSTSFRDMSNRIVLKVHTTYSKGPPMSWLVKRAARVRKLSARRHALLYHHFAEAREIDAKFCTVYDRGAFPHRLETLRIHLLTRGNDTPGAKTLEFPESLRFCDLTFDDSFTRITLRDSKNVRFLKLRGVAMRFSAPDLCVAKDALKCVDVLHLETPGTLVVTCPKVTAIRDATLRAGEYLDPRALDLFGESLRRLDLGCASMRLSLGDLPVNPPELAVTARFVHVDRVWPSLRKLHVTAPQFATIDIPPMVLPVDFRYTSSR